MTLAAGSSPLRFVRKNTESVFFPYRKSDVAKLTPEQIRPAPDMENTLSAIYLTGLGVIDERMPILIDIAKLMSSVDMLGHVEKLAA